MTEPELVLAIDIGSSWCKAAYLDRCGNMVATGRAYTRNIVPSRNKMLEQFWGSVVTAAQMAISQLTVPASPAAIAISCRALFGVCLDPANQAFYPAADEMLSRASPHFHRAYSPEVWGKKDPFAYGYGVRLGATALWLQQDRPEEWRKIARIGALHDYIVYRMTDLWVTDPTTGPGPTGWPHELVEMTGLPPQAFPRTLEPERIVGGLVADTADAFGLPAGTPVVVGLHDGAAANLGVRAIHPGDACLTLGTNFVFRPATGERLTTGCFSYLVAPNSWAWVNNVPSSSIQLDIVAESLLGTSLEMAERHLRLGKLADNVPPGANGLVIRRMLPGQDDTLKRAIAQAQQAGYADGVIYRAMLEAIALGVRDLMNTAMKYGAIPQRFVATGGSAQNHAFLKVAAAVLATPIEIGEPEGGLIGAGMMAALGSGWFATLDEAMRAMTSAHPIVYPEQAAIRYYRALDSSQFRSAKNTQPS